MESRLKELCKEKGVTPYRVAKDCNVSLHAIYDYTSNKRVPKYDAMLRIANYLQVEVKDIWK